MSEKIKVSIIGVTGYTGLELLRVLINHPNIELKYLISQSHTGQKISDVWPHLKNVCELILSDVTAEKAATESDFIFLALPNGEAQKIAPQIIGKTKIIDISGDFRLKNDDMYNKYYGKPHEYREGIEKFIYGLAELQKDEIKKAKNIANPGCFAITTELALLPIREILSHVDVLAVTGSSGSGKTLKEETHHPIRNHNMKSYKVGEHQHIPEIIQTLGITESQISFVPTSGPFTRGIHLTAFLEFKTGVDNDKEKILTMYSKFYKNAPFVRIKENVQLADVIGSNFCDISVKSAGGKVIIQAVIDNLVKGAAGSAVQNMNIMSGLKEETGLLTLSPLFP
ncbi:MAG: N-acetyl-gamma-glutamyl-phosphate reductase [Candidatus Gracilibacteria bacterium]|jgi:N-acetyl-gamma-glutamyl-phosphate reductase